MSAGVCGKRIGFEELFGSSSPTNKRPKCSSFGSPVRSAELGSGSDGDPISALINMFPSMDPEFVRNVLNNKNNEFEEAKESLRTISFTGGLDQTNAGSFDAEVAGRWGDLRGAETATCSQMLGREGGTRTPSFDNQDMTDGAKWVDLLVSEMANAKNINDARQRAAVILEALERKISHTFKTEKEVTLEYASLKEHLQSLINDNQNLKRVFAIQHERISEQEEKAKEVQHLKVMIGQYQEQLHKLELSNYAMKLYLQRSQQHSSFPGNLPPDVS